jgi:hypothetical protein
LANYYWLNKALNGYSVRIRYSKTSLKQIAIATLGMIVCLLLTGKVADTASLSNIAKAIALVAVGAITYLTIILGQLLPMTNEPCSAKLIGKLLTQVH